MCQNEEDRLRNSEKGSEESEIPRGQETVKSDKEWNEKIFKAWETQREKLERTETEINIGKVYSPPSDSIEGRERKAKQIRF